jgi:phytoene synthase
MDKWNRALDAAGIEGSQLRADYGLQRAQARAFKREIVLASHLLLPGRLVPHVLVAIAFMHRTDDLIDNGPVDERQEAFARWEAEVTGALASGVTEDPQLRPLLNTVGAHPDVRKRVLDYLASADADLHFNGFATEADYQAYVDGYSLPAFMLVAGLLGPEVDQGAYEAACRVYIEAIQRLDFINDLAEDLAGDRLTIPEETLKEHGVGRADLEGATNLPAVRGLLADLLDGIERGLGDCRSMTELLPPAHRPMLGCMIRLDELTVAAARRDLSALLRRPASPGKAAALRVLLSGYLQARRLGGRSARTRRTAR